MKFNVALDRTLKDFGLSAKNIAKKADISPQSISDFRRGKTAMSSDNLERVLWALPNEARAYYFQQLGVPSGNMLQQLRAMNAEELSQLIATIAMIIPDLSKTSDSHLQQV